MRKIFGTLLALGIGLFIAFVLLELFFRLTGWRKQVYQVDPKTGLSIKIPGISFVWRKPCFAVRVKINSWGFHDREFSLEKPKDVFRISVLGDSYVEAFQVPLEKSFHKVLEKLLNLWAERLGTQKRFEVYAFGQSGNGQFLNLLYLSFYALHTKPDLVINAILFENDLRDDSIELTRIYYSQTGDRIPFGKPFPAFVGDEINYIPALTFLEARKRIAKQGKLKQILKKSYFISFLWAKWIELKVKGRMMRKEREEKDFLPVDFWVFLESWSDEVARAWEGEKIIWRNIKEMVHDAGAKPTFVSLSGAFRVQKTEFFRKHPFENFDIWKPEKLLFEWAEENRVPYLPLAPIFAKLNEKGKFTLHWECDGHWNEVGHRWAGELLFVFLVSHKLVPLNPDAVDFSELEVYRINPQVVSDVAKGNFEKYFRFIPDFLKNIKTAFLCEG